MNQGKYIEVNISNQTLSLFEGDAVIKQYTISTAKIGPGEQMDSECTPRGKHLIREKIGAGCVANTVFVGREPTGELYHPELREQFPDRDWILTRILWLSGCEAGKTRAAMSIVMIAIFISTVARMISLWVYPVHEVVYVCEMMT